jgi:hypothetical protein
MATTFVFGPYYWPNTNLAPGQAHNFLIGPADVLNAPGVAHASGYPVTNLRNTNFALYLHDMSTSQVDIGHGDISNIQTYVYATFVNDGAATVPAYTAWFTVIRP